MKKLFAIAGLAVLTLSLSGAALAQNTTNQTQKAKQHAGKGQHHRHGAMRHMLSERLSEKLALTTAQKEKIRILNEQFKAQLKGLKDNKTEGSAKKKQAKSLFQQHRQSILSVLTAEQKAKLEAMKKTHRKPAQRRGGGA